MRTTLAVGMVVASLATSSMPTETSYHKENMSFSATKGLENWIEVSKSNLDNRILVEIFKEKNVKDNRSENNMYALKSKKVKINKIVSISPYDFF